MSAKACKRAERLIKIQYHMAAAVADSADLSSFYLSAIPMDESGPPQIDIPLVASTLQHMYICHSNHDTDESYQEIIPGISQHSLYPVLSTMNTQSQIYRYHSDTQVEKASANFRSYLRDEQEQFAKEPNFCEAYS